MMNRKFLSFCAIILGLSCCATKEEREVKKKFYENGSLRIEQSFLHDSIADGYFRMYYLNGKIKSEGYYKSGKKDGVEKNYSESGQLSSIINFVNGLRSDSARWYYEDGKLMMAARFYKDKAFGEGYEFYESGKIKRYLCRNFDGIVLFEMKYDSAGRLLKRNGEGLVNIDVNDLKFKIGDTLKLDILVATPPGSRSVMEVISDIRSPQTKDIAPIDTVNSICNYSKVLGAEGKFKFVGTYRIIYSDGTESSQVFQGNYEVVGK